MCQRMVRRECINLDSVDEGGEGEESNNGPDRMMERKGKICRQKKNGMKMDGTNQSNC